MRLARLAAALSIALMSAVLVTAVLTPRPHAQTAPRPGANERRNQPGNLVGHGGPVKAIKIDPKSGRILTGAFDYAMMAWWSEGGTIKSLRMDDHNGAVNAVAVGGLEVEGATSLNSTKHATWSESTQRYALAAGDDFRVSVWSAVSGERAHRFEGHTGKIVGLAVSVGGQFAASASWDRTARIWDLAKLQPGPVLEGHAAPVNAVAFSDDGSRVFTASADGNIRAFDSATGKLERSIHKHGWGINVLERLPGTDRLVFGALNGTVAIVDGATGDVVRELSSHGRPVLAVAALEKPGLVATGGGDGVIRVMRADDGAIIAEYKNPHGPVWALDFMLDGQSLYYGGLDDFSTLWRFTPQVTVGPEGKAEPRRFQMKAASDDQFAQGEQQFARKCSVCHTLTPDGANRAGPSLHGVFGRRIATLPGYPFSEPLRQMDLVWTEETVAKLFEFGPDVVTPGSKMPLQRMTDKSQRDALIAYLKIVTAPPQAKP